MRVIFNNQLVSSSDFKFDFTDRGFQYGDGLFETMMSHNAKVWHLAEHYQRMVNGMDILRYDMPPYFDLSHLHDLFKELLVSNGLLGPARLKWYVWRKQGGLYDPQSNIMNMLVEAEESSEPGISVRNSVGFSTSARNVYTAISRFKSMSALNYVLAGIDKQKNDWDDVIICDAFGNVSESLNSNIYWLKDNVLYTPDLETGCIEGTVRVLLLNHVRVSGVKFMEVKAGTDELLNADHVFITNAAGFKHILKIENRTFAKSSLVEQWFKDLFAVK